jgi:hypothetical protein
MLTFACRRAAPRRRSRPLLLLPPLDELGSHALLATPGRPSSCIRRRCVLLRQLPRPAGPGQGG